MDTLMKSIGRLNRIAILHRSRQLEGTGLSGIHHSYILHICRNPGTTQEELCKQLYVHKSNVTRQLALLEKEGYLIRTPKKEDKRVQCLFPTDKMQEIYPRVRAMLMEWNDYLLTGFSPQEQRLLSDMLAALVKKAEKRVAPDVLEEGSR